MPVCISDNDHDDVYVALYDRGWDFYSRLLGTDALSGANIVYPVISLIIAAGVMLATGGSALIGKKLGEGKEQEARGNFSFLILNGIGIGMFFLVVGNLFLDPVIRLLGATDRLLPYCADYLSVSLFLAPACMLQLIFQTFFVTAGQPALGLMLTVGGGIANMVLDYLFMVPSGNGNPGCGACDRNWATDPGGGRASLFSVQQKDTLACKAAGRFRSDQRKLL